MQIQKTTIVMPKEDGAETLPGRRMQDHRFSPQVRGEPQIAQYSEIEVGRRFLLEGQSYQKWLKGATKAQPGRKPTKLLQFMPTQLVVKL